MKFLHICFFGMLLFSGFSNQAFAQIPTDSLKLHLRADVGITSSGDSVSAWADQSGNGFNSTQAIATNRPSYVANAINGEPVVRFNGIDDYFVLPSAADLGINDSDYEVFVIYRSVNTHTNIEFILASEDISHYELHTNSSAPSGLRYIPNFDGSNFVDLGGIGEYSDQEPYLINLQASSSSGKITINGTDSTRLANNAHSSSTAKLLIGKRSDSSFPLNGDVAEVIIYNSVLTDSARALIENYLGNKYGIDVPAIIPSVQASAISISEIDDNSMKVSLTSGNGGGRLIVAKKGSPVDFDPTDSTTYSANSVFESGTELGNGNYVVYNGTGEEVTVTGLQKNIHYYFSAFEYNGATGKEKYLITSPAVGDGFTTGFDFESISSLASWLRVDDGIASTTNGASVDIWSDGSVNSYNATQAIENAKPIFTTNSLNGFPGLTFDGTKYLTLPSSSTLGIQNSDYEVFIVAKPVNSTAVEFLMGGVNTSNYELHLNGGQGVRFIPVGVNYLDDGAEGVYSDGNAHIFHAKATSSGGYVQVNGGAGASSIANLQSSIDTPIDIGRRGNNTLFYNGEVYEVLVFENTLSVADRDSVAKYLSEKYGISYTFLSEPTVQASNVSFSGVTDTGFTINFTAGNGSNRIILIKEGAEVDAFPTDGTVYSSDAAFGLGAQIGTGNYVVYNGSGNSVTVTGLTTDTEYQVAVMEYDGLLDEVNYLTTNPATGSQSTTLAPIEISGTTFSTTSTTTATFGAIAETPLTTSYRVLFGTGNTVFSDSTSLIVGGTGISTDTLSFELTGLSSNTLYYAKLKAINSNETVLSGFETLFFNNTTIPKDSLGLWLSATEGFNDKSQGETISLWYDLSGKRNNATQSNGSNMPSLDTSAVNGLPALSFNGSSTLVVSTALGIENSDFEIFIVAKSSNGSGGYIWTKQINGSFYPSLSYNYNDDGLKFVGSFDSSNPQLGAGSNDQYNDGIPHVFNAVATSNSGLLKIDAETVAEDSGKDFTHSGAGFMYIGSAGNNHSFLNGYISEIILYKKVLSGLEKYQVHSYLSEKYDLDLPLNTPTQQVTDLQFQKTGAASATLNFSPGSGLYNLAVVKANSEVDGLPVDSTTYTTSSEFGSGSEIGTGNYVVSVGSDSSVAITGLTPGTTYHATVFSFNGDSGFEKYLTTSSDTASLFLAPSTLISELSPTPYSVGNEANTTIEVTFSDAMKTPSFVADSSFIVRGSESGFHSGTFQFSAGNTVATFTPDSTFKPGEKVTVNLTNKLEGVSKSFEDPRVFSFTIKTRFSSATFQKAMAVDQNFNAQMTGISDLNSDGEGDIYMVDSGGSVHVRLNNGNKSYSSKIEYSTNAEPKSTVAADIDGDGDLDIIVSNDDGNDISILKNNGDGTFASSIDINISSSSYSIESGDLNHDGDADLIVGTRDNFLILLNDGSGVFSTPTSYGLGSNSYDIIDLGISDLDSDGDLDLIALDQSTSFYFSKNNGDGTFQQSILLDQVDNPSSVSIGDLDHDGDADFVISSTDDSRIYVYKNNGDATFAAREQYDVNSSIKRLFLFDLDGDGDLDVIGKESSNQYLYIFLNPGDGTFPSYSTLNVNNTVDSFSLSDFDNDDDLDLFVSTYDSLYIYENINLDPLTLTGTAGWRLMASPAGKVQYRSVLNNLWTQGITGADSESGAPNVYYWPSTSTSISDTNWTAITNMSDSLQSGQGMLMYVFSDDNGPSVEGDAGFPKEISFPGSEPTNTQVLTSLLNTNDDSWTLLGNPFYQDIDWDDFYRGNLSNSVYVYDVNASGWKVWNGFLGSLTDGIIGIYDAFFVEAENDEPYLEISNPNGGGGFETKAIAKRNASYFSLVFKSDSGFANKAWFQFSEGGEFGIDASDAYQLNPLSPNYVTMASILNDTVHLDINSLPVIDEALEIPLALQTTETGTTHSISLGDMNISEGWEVKLYDSELDITTDLTEPYVFTMASVKVKTQNLESPQDADSPPSMESIFHPAKQKQAGARFTLTIIPAATVNGEPVSDLPQVVELEQNYPNPFNPSSVIQFGVPELSKVRLEVFDILGRKVATLLNNETKSAGRYNVQFNAGNLASGMYVYRLQVGNKVLTKKMTLIK